MKSMKECLDIMEDMIKSLSFNPERPVEMSPDNSNYQPYNFVDGGYLPYDSEHWQQFGKNPEDYLDNDLFHRKYLSTKKSVADALDSLVKGGEGSGRKKTAGPYDKDRTVLEVKNLKEEMEKLGVDNIFDFNRKKRELTIEQAKESLKRSEGSMNQIFTTESRSLLNNIEEDQSLAKSIQDNDYHAGGKPNISSLLKNTHGEQFCTDADKEVIDYLTTVGQIDLDDVPKEYQLPDYAYANAKKSENDADMKKTDNEETDDEETDDEAQEADGDEGEETEKSLVEEALNILMKSGSGDYNDDDGEDTESSDDAESTEEDDDEDDDDSDGDGEVGDREEEE